MNQMSIIYKYISQVNINIKDVIFPGCLFEYYYKQNVS